VANVEFKLDERDGKLKLIECNARFTAADCLLVSSGLNLPLFVYDRLIGRSHPAQSSYRIGMRLWKPVGDFAAYRQLSKLGLLTFGAWVRSIMHRQILPIFRWNDPLPAIVSSVRLVRYAASRLLLSKPSRGTAGPLPLSRVAQPLPSLSTTRVTSDIHKGIEAIGELPRK
jgi:predicted ATP-grasp superfamily ATP-dependent carboligase